jgi:hypothetical protein
MEIHIDNKKIVVSSWLDKEVLLLYERMKPLHPEGFPLEDFFFNLLLHGIESHYEMLDVMR